MRAFPVLDLPADESQWSCILTLIIQSLRTIAHRLDQFAAKGGGVDAGSA
jgi:hypothetical protein